MFSMLNVSSRSAEAALEEQSTPARIRDAAIRHIAAHGVADTTARGVARDADVSPGLVIHHFGSMDRLRVVCDQHVVAVIRRSKTRAMSAGSLDPLAAARDTSIDLPVLAYLARTLTDGSPHVAELVAEMAEDAVGYLKAGQETGVIGQVEDLRGAATVLTIWSLGAIVLHEHVNALLGVDLLSTDLMTSPKALRNYQLPALDLMSGDLIPAHVRAQIRTVLGAESPNEQPRDSDPSSEETLSKEAEQ